MMMDRWFAGETLDEIATPAGVSRWRVRHLILLADSAASVNHRAKRREQR